LIEITKEEILHLKTELPPIQEALNKFNNPLIRDFVREALEKAPDGLWLDPCSSTGKYHPPFDQVVPGGLVNHMLVSTYFVEQGIRRYHEFTDEKFQPDPKWLDLARAACMLHDIAKCGIPWGERTVPNHGHLGAEFLKGLESFQKLSLYDRHIILRGVKWHMGRWEEGFRPERSVDSFEHLIQEADFYSTRKKIRVAGFNLINYECDEA